MFGKRNDPFAPHTHTRTQSRAAVLPFQPPTPTPRPPCSPQRVEQIFGGRKKKVCGHVCEGSETARSNEGVVRVNYSPYLTRVVDYISFPDAKRNVIPCLQEPTPTPSTHSLRRLRYPVADINPACFPALTSRQVCGLALLPRASSTTVVLLEGQCIKRTFKL